VKFQYFNIYSRPKFARHATRTMSLEFRLQRAAVCFLISGAVSFGRLLREFVFPDTQ
jgi:hypothetical protein